MTNGVLWMRLFSIEAGAGHKVGDWAVSRYGPSPVLATEVQHSGFFLWGQWHCGSVWTSHLSKLPWWEIKDWITLIVTQLPARAAKILWLQQLDSKTGCASHLLRLKRCMVLQLAVKPMRLDLRVMAPCSTRVPKYKRGREVRVIKLLWHSMENSAELQLQIGVTSAQNWKPHPCGVRHH